MLGPAASAAAAFPTVLATVTPDLDSESSPEEFGYTFKYIHEYGQVTLSIDM